MPFMIICINIYLIYLSFYTKYIFQREKNEKKQLFILPNLTYDNFVIK